MHINTTGVDAFYDVNMSTLKLRTFDYIIIWEARYEGMNLSAEL